MSTPSPSPKALLPPIAPARAIAARGLPRSRLHPMPDDLDELGRELGPMVAVAFAVPASAMSRPTRGAPDAARARQCAMYLAHTVLGLNYGEVGRLFGRDRTTAAHACRRIEDWRDDPAADARLAALERACADLVCRQSLTCGVRS